MDAATGLKDAGPGFEDAGPGFDEGVSGFDDGSIFDGVSATDTGVGGSAIEIEVFVMVSSVLTTLGSVTVPRSNSSSNSLGIDTIDENDDSWDIDCSIDADVDDAIDVVVAADVVARGSIFSGSASTYIIKKIIVINTNLNYKDFKDNC